uniref:Uncharacterized protein n=1 Tax=Papio anubis TaxID=9555 RepID=A0A8I5NC17_PAPAN
FQEECHQVLFVPLVKFDCESLWSWAFFLVCRLLITAITSELVIGLFKDLTSSWFSLGRVYVSRNYPFLLDFLVYLHRIFFCIFCRDGISPCCPS